MIHPTTNPVTLGRAYSNGCIGTAEADAWIIYYHAPPGTPLKIRYDLEVRNVFNELQNLEDTYHDKRE
jgi:L,D-transpeptidase ErfK/SrfK